MKDWRIRDPGATKYTIKNVSELDKELWVLVSPELINVYNKIVSQSIKLFDLVGDDNIFNGIQTSANEIYIFTPYNEDSNYYYFNKKNSDYKIEKGITKPYFQTSKREDNLNTYRTFKPNARVIYPYENTRKGVELLPLTTLKKVFPFAFNYLQQHKDILNNPKRDIKPIPLNKGEWHRYGRHQSLDSCGVASKIIVGVLSVGDKYAIDFHGTLISSGGTAGYCVIAIPNNLDYSIYYVQAILNSKYLEWFSAIYGEVFRGGYIARGTKVLKNLPIRSINFKNSKDKGLHDNIAKVQKELINVYDKIDSNIGNNREITPLQRHFEITKNTLDKLLFELYELGSDDSLIPLIKELYEAN